MRIGRNQVIILLVLLALLLGGALKYGQYLGQNDSPPPEEGLLNQSGLSLAHGEEASLKEEEAAPIPIPTEDPLMVVDIKGAVENPGVISLPEGSRLNDALALARALPEANLDRVNLARILLDGEAVYIPFQGQDEAEIAAIEQISNSDGAAGSNSSGGASPAINNGKVNINKASAAELQSLSGIGPAKAQAIINYREEHGSFSRIEDLTKVSGIGPATLEKLKNDITVD